MPAGDISFVYLEKPYYLEPTNRAEKVYALLREAMSRASLVGIARIVMHNKEHLAALLPAGPALMLGTLRWANEIRPASQLNLPSAGDDKLKDAELKMAGELIRKMAGNWKPEQFADRFSAAIRKLVARKAAAGEAKAVAAAGRGARRHVERDRLERVAAQQPGRKGRSARAALANGEG